MLVFPILITERLKFRQLTVDDFEALVELANNRNISQQIVNIPYPFQEFNAVHRLSYVAEGFKTRQRFVFAIVCRDNDKFIGEISINIRNNTDEAEIGYWIGEPYWNNGYGSEAIAGISKFAFEILKLKTLFATVNKDNLPSIKALTNNDFKHIKKSGMTDVYIKYLGLSSGKKI
jgi:ribosomal-protein-alanine N-acetyltransferase